MKWVTAVVLAVASAAPLALLVAPSPRADAQTAPVDLRPDLRMEKLWDLKISKEGGRRLLRFSAVIVNVGVGPFEASGRRTDTNAPTMTDTNQRVYDDAGGYRDVSTPGAEMYFGGDGHTHWHVRNLESYELDRQDNGAKVGTGAKSGFCFYDNYQFNFDPNAYPGAYWGCGGSSELSVTMGLSKGWGDMYHSSLPDQYIDIGGLTAGNYRLWATADRSNWYIESDEANNWTYCDIHIGPGTKLRNLGCGGYATPLG